MSFMFAMNVILKVRVLMMSEKSSKVENMSKEELFEKAVELWGEDAQIGMLIEEIGEVLVALNKRSRNLNDCSEHELVEELTDLKIMIEQMKIILSGYDWDLVKWMKIRQLREHLEVSEG